MKGKIKMITRSSLVFTIMVLILAFCVPGESETKKFDHVVTISTQFGDMTVLLYDGTPKHKENFIKLANEGFYDSTTFHRVIKQFMVQGGDPLTKDKNPENDGNGGPGYTIPAEFDTLYFHKKGALAAARQGDNVNPNKESSGSQFYIVHGRTFNDSELQQISNMTGVKYSKEQKKFYKKTGGAPHLDGQYTVFGEVISGLNIIDSIAYVKTGYADRPYNNVYMTVKAEKMKRKKITSKYGYVYPEDAVQESPEE